MSAPASFTFALAGRLSALPNTAVSSYPPEPTPGAGSGRLASPSVAQPETPRQAATASGRADLRSRALVDAARHQPFAGVLGKLTFGADGDPVRPMFVYEVAKGGDRLVAVVE